MSLFLFIFMLFFWLSAFSNTRLHTMCSTNQRRIRMMTFGRRVWQAMYIQKKGLIMSTIYEYEYEYSLEPRRVYAK